MINESGELRNITFRYTASHCLPTLHDDNPESSICSHCFSGTQEARTSVSPYHGRHHITTDAFARNKECINFWNL
jgi:hypothetical protein